MQTRRGMLGLERDYGKGHKAIHRAVQVIYRCHCHATQEQSGETLAQASRVNEGS